MHIESTRLKGVKGKNFEADMNRETVLEMREMLKHWNQFFKTVGYEETYAAFDIEDDKMKKLVRLLNFEYIRDNLGFSIFRYIGE